MTQDKDDTIAMLCNISLPPHNYFAVTLDNEIAQHFKAQSPSCKNYIKEMAVGELY